MPVPKRVSVADIAAKAMKSESLTRADSECVMALRADEVAGLVASVFPVRRKHKGLRVGIQLLTNARSGDCSQSCAYCAQSRAADSQIEKYRFAALDKIKSDGELVSSGGLSRHCIGLSGIRFSDEEIDELADCVKTLKLSAPTPICCSIGFLTEKQGRRLKKAGVDRINHNLNTSRENYSNICDTHSYDERVANIKLLQSIGFEICCGGIIGMGEGDEGVVDMLLAISELSPQAVPINFLIPIEGTRMRGADVSHLTPEYCLKVLCLARLLMPNTDIRCAAGRELYLAGREKDLFKVVDSVFASGYLTTGGQTVDEVKALVKSAGFEPFDS